MLLAGSINHVVTIIPTSHTEYQLVRPYSYPRSRRVEEVLANLEGSKGTSLQGISASSFVRLIQLKEYSIDILLLYLQKTNQTLVHVKSIGTLVSRKSGTNTFTIEPTVPSIDPCHLPITV